MDEHDTASTPSRRDFLRLAAGTGATALAIGIGWRPGRADAAPSDSVFSEQPGDATTQGATQSSAETATSHSRWTPTRAPSPGNAATFFGSHDETTNLNGATELTSIVPNAYCSVWQGSDPKVEFTGCSGAARFEVRDYDGVIVSSGSVSEDRLVVHPPAHGWRYGWYRIYFFTGQRDGPLTASATNLGWTSSILVIPDNPNLPSVPPVKDWRWGGMLPPDVWETHALGYGMIRYNVQDPTVQPNPDVATIVKAMGQEKQWWLNHYTDPVRPHKVFVAFPNGAYSAAQLAGVTAIAKQLVPEGVHYFEGPSNEPDIDAPGFIAKCRAFTAAVHAGGGKSVGPSTVICNQSWLAPGGQWDSFLSAGGSTAFDVISTHGYNSTINDGVNAGRRNWHAFRALLKKHHISRPVWMTECGVFQCVYSVLHVRRARSVIQFYLNMEEVGIPRENVAYFYPQNHGFPEFPSYFETGGYASYAAQLASSGLMRTLAEETFAKTFTRILSFGLPTDHEVMSDLFSGPDGSAVVVSVAATIVDDCYVSFTIATKDGTARPTSLEVIDGWGNASRVTPSGASGVVTLPIYDTPTYLRLPTGVTATPVRSGLNNLARRATANSPLLVDRVFGTGPAYDADPGPYFGKSTPSASAPDSSVQLSWSSPKTIGRVVIYAGQVWQHNSTLTDFDLVDDAGNVLASVSRPIPPPLGYNAPWQDTCTTAEVYWNEQWIFDIALAEQVRVKGIGLNVRGVSFGGEPDVFCCTNLGQGDPTPVVAIQEIEVYRGPTKKQRRR